MAAVDETICRMISAGRFISRGKGRHITRVIDSYELILVVSGVLEMFEESRRFRVAAGEYLVLSPGRRHGGIGAYGADLSFFWCHFLARSEAGKARLAALAGSAPAARPERFADCFSQLLTELKAARNNPGEHQRCIDLLGELLLAEAALPQERVVSRDAAGTIPEQAETLIRLHFEEDISTATLARELGCHPDYLGRLYRERFGCTVIDAINDARIECARKLLVNSHLSVKEIAFESGYNDPVYFRRQFFRRTAMTPGEYRRCRSGGHINTE